MSVYVNELDGSDAAGVTGTESEPFQTPAYALFQNPDAKLFIFKQLEDSEEFGYVEISASALKKAKKGADGLRKKQEKAAKSEEDQKKKDADAAAKLAKLDLIKIEEDKSLPKAKKIKLRDIQSSLETRVQVQGWVHRVRVQKGLAFVTLRDGTGFLQIVFTGELAKARSTVELTLESSISVKGVISKLQEGKTAPGGVERKADF